MTCKLDLTIFSLTCVCRNSSYKLKRKKICYVISLVSHTSIDYIYVVWYPAKLGCEKFAVTSSCLLGVCCKWGDKPRMEGRVDVLGVWKRESYSPGNVLPRVI